MQWLIWPDVKDAGKDWRRKEKQTTENEMVGWYHQLDGHEFEQAPGVGDWEGHLACCSPWGHKELDTTKQLNWTDAEAETPILQPPDVKNQLIGKFPNAGKDEGRRRTLTEHELVRWHHFSMDMSLNNLQEIV